MGALEFQILYNENYISISNLFEGVGEGSNQDINNYQNIGDSYYSQNYKGFYYLKRNYQFHKLKIHNDCPDLDQYFAIKKANNEIINLPQPVLKGCYPISGIRQNKELPSEDTITKTIKNGKLLLYNNNTGETQVTILPRVVGVEITGGGGAGGNTGLGDILGNYYFAGGGGGGGTLIAYLDTYNNGTTITFSIGSGGSPSASKTGTGGSGSDSTISFGSEVIAIARGGWGGGGSSDGTLGKGGQYGTCSWTNTPYFQMIHNIPGQWGYTGIAGTSLSTTVINELKIKPNEGYSSVKESPFYTVELSKSISDGYDRVQGTKSYKDYVCKGSGGASAWGWGQTIIVSNDTANVSLDGPFWTDSEGITSHTNTVGNCYGAGGAGARISGLHVGDDWRQGHAGYKGRIRLFW